MVQSNFGRKSPQVVVVGAGLGGIAAGAALKTQLALDNFTIFEKASAVGGTWRDNTYPGCGSDVPGHWYSLSTDLNPKWSRYNVGQPELRAYWEAVYHRYSLSAHTVFNTTVVQAEWDNDSQRYRITLQNGVTGERTEIEAEAMILAAGGLVDPKFPKDLPGTERFRGSMWHSARWRHDINLRGKRVAVIGNGCSAAQFIPQISRDPTVEVINFCRTPQWFVPSGNYSYHPSVKWMFEHVPGIMRLYRNFLMAKADATSLVFRKTNTRLVNFMKWRLSNYIQSRAPKEEHKNLIPKYPPGCKRLILDPGYLSSLKQPNVNLNWTPIQEVVEEGIKLKTGEIISVDIIIFGTGYTIELTDLRVRGSNGSTMQEYFDTQGGPTAYIGSCIPGFPNLFTLLGPNVATGHASVVFTEEAQLDMAMQLIKPVIEGKARSFEVRAEATDEYNHWLQNRMADSVWTECNSFYHSGDEHQKKVVVTFPGPVTLFWWMARRPRWDHFKAVGAEQWFSQRTLEKAQSRKRVLRLLVLFMTAAACVFAGTRLRSILPSPGFYQLLTLLLHSDTTI